MNLEPLSPNNWEVVEFSDHPKHDTIWTITMGKDGQVYVGLCLEGTGGGVAQVYKYDTNQRCLRYLADMGEVTGEPPDNGHATQGKVHFSLCHASDGKLYGATHCTTPPIGQKLWSPLSMWDDPDMSFPGAHIFRHDTLSNEIVDFGVITPNDGIPYLMLDEERQCLYGATFPKAHFFRCSLQGRDFKDYGRISSWYPISMVFDSVGNLYTSDVNSQLIKYDVAQDKLIFLDTRPYAHPWNTDARFSWITDMCLAEDGWIYGLTYSNGHLFRFDPREETPQIEDLGTVLPELSVEMIRCIVPDNKGHLYFVAQAAGVGNILVQYDIATKHSTAQNLLQFNDKQYLTWRGVCGSDGTIYLATIQTLPCALLIYRP